VQDSVNVGCCLPNRFQLIDSIRDQATTRDVETERVYRWQTQPGGSLDDHAAPSRSQRTRGDDKDRHLAGPQIRLELAQYRRRRAPRQVLSKMSLQATRTRAPGRTRRIAFNFCWRRMQRLTAAAFSRGRSCTPDWKAARHRSRISRDMDRNSHSTNRTSDSRDRPRSSAAWSR
jgi:hypothetical protein